MLNQIMSLTSRTSLRAQRPALLVAILISFSSAGLVGCKSESVTDSASTQETPTPAASTQATPAPAETAAAENGEGLPVPTRDANGNAVSIDKDGKVTDLPITVSPAKPMLTPAPDPFPARPTPAVVMKNGKIVQQWEAPAESLSLANPVGNSPQTIAMGKELYSQRCVDCHGKEGKGNGWLSKGIFKPPTNIASKVVQANSDGELFWKITNGKSPMPANRIRFTDEQRWQIVSYIRTFKP
jgi:mono/diheme cytochrome c family protein